MRLVCWLGISLGTCGCAGSPAARYVYQDGDFGVIGIPCNTVLDRVNYRGQAELLMARHFPDGYEIVRAEEVVEGQRTVNVGNVSEIGAEPALAASNQTIALGRVGRSKSYQEKDQLQLRECRIIYRRRPPGAPYGPGPFAAVASLTPPLYVDPNDGERRRTEPRTVAQGRPLATPANDDHAQTTLVRPSTSAPGPPASHRPGRYGLLFDLLTPMTTPESPEDLRNVPNQSGDHPWRR